MPGPLSGLPPGHGKGPACESPEKGQTGGGEDRPLVLATTKLYNDYVVDATAKLGVEYLMIKPCNIRAVVGRVKDLSNSLSKPSLSAPDRRTHVSNLLVSLGVSTKLRGYSYLREPGFGSECFT